MPIRFNANRRLFKRVLVSLAAIFAVLNVLRSFDGANIDEAVLAYGPVGSSACETPTSVVVNRLGMPEARGATEHGEAWALVFSAFRHSQRVKIVWRMTGSGRFSVAAHKSGFAGPLRPEFGPINHNSSTWVRPGDEWGTVFVFPEAGCWRIELSRDDARATFWFNVE